MRTPAELDALALPPPGTDPDSSIDPELDHPDGDWIRPFHEFLRQEAPLPPPAGVAAAVTTSHDTEHDSEHDSDEPPF